MGILRGSKWMSRKIRTLALVFGVVLAYAAVAEAAPQYTLNCNSCHQMPPIDSPDAKKKPATGAIPGNHQGHASAAVNSCVTCHGAGVSGYGSSHRNKTIELSDTLSYGRKVNGFLNQTSIPPNPLGSCANASCHSNGKGIERPTPAWGTHGVVNCDTCHDAAPSTQSHPKHVSSTLGYGFNCDKCHTNHATEPVASRFQHATSAGKREIDVHFTTAPNSGGAFTGNQCSGIYCHSNGQSGTANVKVMPVWGGSVTCAGCHGDGVTGAPLSGKHANHVNNSALLGSNYGCVECHSATVSNNSTISDKTQHVDGGIDVAGTRVGPVTAGVTCATSYCHSDGKGTSPQNYKSVNWTQTTALGCDGCHGTSASFGAPAYANTGAGSGNANSHGKHATSTATCANCHSKTTSTGSSIIAGSQHTNGFRNFTSGNGKTFGKQAGLTCSNISCHSGGGIVANVPAAQWGASLTCAGCHGDSATLATQSHPRHLLKGISCETCHSDTATGSDTIKPGAPHANSVTNVVGAAGILTFDPAANTCATQCHKNTLPVWGSSTTGSCGTCHSVAPAFNIGFSPAANQPLHDFHFSGSNNGPKLSAANATGCQVCHFFTDDLGATHNNGSVNLNTGYGTVNTACGTCHKQTTNWVNARVTCESCHSTAGGALSVINGKTAPDKTTAATLGHGKPSINQACTICHNRDSQHIGVNGGTTRLFAKYSSSAAGAGCNTCHNNSAVVATASMQNMKVHRLSGLGSTCSDCHNPHGTANSMMVETAINGVAVSYSGKGTFANAAGTGVCQACHTNTIYFTKNNSPAPQQHVDSTEDCTSCHKHNPTDGSRAFSAPGNCDSCHGYPPAPRNVAGLIFGKQGQWSSARFEDYSGGGGAHIVGAHIPATAKASDGWANCTPCHKNASASHLKVLPIRNHVENITVSVDPQLRFSNDAQATYTSAKLVSAGANRTGSCFNVNCHFKTTLKWSSER